MTGKGKLGRVNEVPEVPGHQHRSSRAEIAPVAFSEKGVAVLSDQYHAGELESGIHLYRATKPAEKFAETAKLARRKLCATSSFTRQNRTDPVLHRVSHHVSCTQG
jgi:hypothetical protein